MWIASLGRFAGPILLKNDTEARLAKPFLLGGRKRPQVREAEGRSWTPRKERAFLASLAETCNVKLSAKRAGVSHNCVYERRNRSASFRASWDAALATGYAQLELMMLERALHGVEKTVIARDGTARVMREYSDRTALALLRMHRENAAIANETVDDNEWQEARDRIVARLQRIRERDEKLETKSSADRLALIGWALGAI
jgi:hypothetical protein